MHPKALLFGITVFCLGLQGCAGGLFRIEASQETDGLSLRTRENVLAAHSHAGKKRKGDGPVWLGPRVRLDASGEKSYWMELVHEYRDGEHALGDVHRLELTFKGRETRAYEPVDVGTSSRNVRIPKAGGFFLGMLEAMGEYERAECRMQNVYVCQESDYPTEDELWRTETILSESALFSVTRAELRDLARLKLAEVKVFGTYRAETYAGKRIPFRFKMNIRRFLDTLKTAEADSDRRLRRARRLHPSTVSASPEESVSTVAEEPSFRYEVVRVDSLGKKIPRYPGRLDQAGYPTGESMVESLENSEDP